MPSRLFGGHRIAQGADPGDLDLEHVAGLHVDRRRAAMSSTPAGVPVAMMSPGARLGEIGRPRMIWGSRRSAFGARAVHLLAVEARHQGKLRRVGDLVAGHHHGTERSGGDKVLARCHRMLLPVAHAAVDEAGVAGNVPERVALLDVAPGLPMTAVSSPSKSNCVDTLGRSSGSPWPSRVSVRRRNTLGAGEMSRPVSAAWSGS